MAHVRGGRKRARRCYLTKKTFEGTTTLQMRWEIVNLYAYEGVRGWAELSRRFSALHPRSPRQSKTCHRVVNLWKATGDVWPRSSAGSGPGQGHRRFARHMTEDVMTFIQMHVRLHPAAYINRDLVPLLRELLDRPTLSEAAVYDAVRRLGITHKGIRRINSEKCPTKIGLFTERMAICTRTTATPTALTSRAAMLTPCGGGSAGRSKARGLRLSVICAKESDTACWP
jgi:hypothetical protein